MENQINNQVNNQVNNQDEQEFLGIVKTVSWRNFKVKASELQGAYQEVTESWSDYLPNHEYVVTVEIVPNPKLSDRV